MSQKEVRRMKKPWEDPKLIVISRARPGESILTFAGCKGTGSEADQSEKHTGCDYPPPTPGKPCVGACFTIHPS